MPRGFRRAPPFRRKIAGHEICAGLRWIIFLYKRQRCGAGHARGLIVSSSKVYVIDPKSRVETFLQKGGIGKRGFEHIEYSPDAGTQQGEEKRSSRSRRRRATGPAEEQGSPLLALLSYLAGPFAILATRRGRAGAFWIATAVLSSAFAGFIVARSGTLFAPPSGSGIGFVVWLSLACLAVSLGFAAWARGAFLLGRHRGHLLRKLPASLRRPGAAGLLGLLIPGYGLFVAGHPRRAALSLLAACAAAVSVIVLWQASDLWGLSSAGIFLGHAETLERVFLAMGAAIVFAAFAWIVQALEGARLAGPRFEGGAANPARPHGDWAAAALVLAIVAFLAAFKPARVAETIDRFGVSVISDGYRVIPLAAAETAMRLDPSRPEYAMQAIQLNEALGRRYRAEVLRYYLEDRWEPYDRMLRLEASVLEPVEPAVPGPEAP